MIYQPICSPPLPDVLGGRVLHFQSPFGRVVYNCAGRGEPLLLVHGINAGASNFEWRENFQTLARNFTVYALDLPGFARSDKCPEPYTAQIYIQTITAFIEQVIQKPVYCLASGLSAGYCCSVAFNRSYLIKKLALVTPSGVGNNAEPPCATSFTVYGIFTSPIQGDGVYNAFVSPESIRYFLTTFIYTREEFVTETQVHYQVASSHQCPHAKYAPASFVAGLSNINIASFFGDIHQPSLIIWGAQAQLNPVRNLEKYLTLNNRAQSYVFPDSGLIPQFERASEFNSLVAQFFSS